MGGKSKGKEKKISLSLSLIHTNPALYVSYRIFEFVRKYSFLLSLLGTALLSGSHWRVIHLEVCPHPQRHKDQRFGASLHTHPPWHAFSRPLIYWLIVSSILLSLFLSVFLPSPLSCLFLLLLLLSPPPSLEEAIHSWS